MKVNPFTHPIAIIVKEPEWQKLRASLVGTWIGNEKKNVKLLRAYLGDMKSPRRVRIVLNYLVGSAFRLGKVQAPEIDKLLKELRSKWAKMKVENGSRT